MSHCSNIKKQKDSCSTIEEMEFAREAIFGSLELRGSTSKTKNQKQVGLKIL